MALKLIFLGSGSAFTLDEDNYHSNVLLQKDHHTMLIDAGSDIRFSLHKLRLNHRDIQNVYISHLHADHIGGLEWLALSTYFDPGCKDKPHLYISEHLVNDLWEKSLCGGLSTLQTEQASLKNFFNVHVIKQHEQLIWQDIPFKLVQAVHVISDYELMPCYGLMFEYNQTRIYLTADTQYAPSQLLDYYEKADIIFHDCETSACKSGVHAHYSELLNIPGELKKKIWLYHYNPGKLPNAKADGFLGFVKRGQVFTF
ncbi:MBL fold metallo-hydrolase [Legionella spiritensis]|uniref:Metal-dependent hydrolase of the beta-lactamase superfamily transporter III n=1 Tax=Legionella spiritensis TaxID=452 RepID=A0A0W0Z4F7_LEGSP|nr:MBL fold metallo-hydrolase [Legionella spiritensis]KTD63985.1 metal-dependent hydrolase of the beta-lactamase superfamily transporter III [Legionella spiritensis]SNV36998.1 metal-dependent hydrolase of the beta-lactamase superfamily transporter III [Legionella spiritensis]